MSEQTNAEPVTTYAQGRTLAEAAQDYAARKWQVFPVHGIEDGKCTCNKSTCIAQGKHPRTKNGFKDATTDPEQISRWWTKWPNANIGIRTGLESNIIVADVDQPDKKPPGGVSNIMARTGRIGGGFHHYFWHPGGDVPCAVYDWGERKADRGYVIAPPSMHLSGQRYRWINYSGNLPMDPPTWITKKPKKGETKGAEYTEIPLTLEKGERHPNLKIMAARLRNTGMTPREIYGTLQVVNQTRCDPPKPDSELFDLAQWFKDKDSDAFKPDRFFSKKPDGTINKFIVSILAEEIMAEHRFLATDKRSKILQYEPDRGIWTPGGEESIRGLARTKLRNLSTSYYVNETASYIRDKNYIDVDRLGAPKHIIIMENGAYNLDTGQLEPYAPDMYAIAHIPITYDPEATCPQIDAYLEEVAGEYKPTIYEFTGYCYYKATPIHRFFILHGPGGNSKGTTINLIKTALGRKNITAIPIQALTDNTFSCAGLHGKLANLCNDISKKALRSTGRLKEITSGDRINAQHKYGNPFDFEPHAKLLFSANEVPPTTDRTLAFFRRSVLIPYLKTYTDGDNADHNILTKLTTPQELSGFFNKSIAALSPLLKRGKFTGERTNAEKQLEYIKNSDPIAYFVETQVYKALDSYITKRELYTEYATMCADMGKIPTTDNWFSKRVKALLPYNYESKRQIQGSDKQVRVWVGVRTYRTGHLSGDLVQRGLT